MAKYILKRILWMIPVLLGVMILIYTINYLSPSDPLTSILGADATEAQRAAKAAELGLDQPYLVQVFNYIKGVVLHLDLGTSYTTYANVMGSILERFPTTLLLALLSVIFATIIGIPLGVIAATHRNSIFDYISSILAMIGASMPNFWLGLMLIIWFALDLGWLPASGLGTVAHWVLPVIACGFFPVATIMRTTRSSMLEVIRQDYIRTAESKGIANKEVILKHAFRNAMIPVITIVGMQFAFAMGGVITLEAVFTIPGMGSLLKTAIGSNDYPTIEGCVLFIAFITSVMNLLIDILYAVIDPRVKTQYASSKKKKKAVKEVAA